MASQSASSDATLDQMTINLQIISPSVGVNRPLQFPATPTSTNVKTLKRMIRDSLSLRPTDSNQRLIYRGKALLRDHDTLLDILGADAVRNNDTHTMHLVLRDVDQPPAPNSTTPHNASASNQAPRPVPRFLNHLGHGLGPGPAPAGAADVAQPVQPPVQPRIPSPAPLGQQLPPPAAAAFQQQHQQLTSWLNQVQREAMSRAVNQNQRGRAQAGMRGVADAARDPSSRRGSPAPTHTIYRETQGPNGRSYHMETVIRNPAPTGGQTGSYSVTDIQNMVRNADSGQGPSAPSVSMQRTASTASLPVRSAPSLLNMASAQVSQPRQGLELYLLSSPEGPRGILINNSTMETFYTPRNSFPAPVTAPSQMTVREWLLTPPDAPGYEDSFADIPDERYDYQGEIASRHARDQANARQYQVQAQALHQPPPPAMPAEGVINQPAVQPALRPLHGGNPMAGLGQLLLRLGPHIWNIGRLGFFVWLFVGPDSSWTRWFVVISAAVLTFAVGTGAFNGMSEHLWRPMMRHLENLFPTLDRPNQRQPLPAAQPGINPNPADMAARLVADHNGRQPWLSEQLRRVERAGLLFLASIAPGVAERHIANLEEVARQEEGVFTSLIENLGVKDIQFEELLTLDPSELLTLQPVHGVIFLFKYPTDKPYATPDGPLDGKFDHTASERIFFAAQTIQNACATQALLSVLLNQTGETNLSGDDSYNVDVGEKLRDFREFTMVLPPEFRGEALSNSDLIREVHNSFARSNPFVDETQRDPNAESEDAFHFVAYTPVGGTLYELDGLQPAPIAHGACSRDQFPARVVDVLQRRVARYEATEIRFNLLAMCRDLRVRAREFGDAELLEREERKRREWRFENALRRHNFVGFAGEVLKGVAADRLRAGGDKAVEAWVDESLERRKVAEKALRGRGGGDGDVDMS
ncbi:hypothetical protein V2A60_004668 [Cordyceps javanica]|uniref:ubiquitinyl hydrolase 1 n=1 Tax=Cordyceps javanica TaxID=43265 RepID=A0A545VBT2_9HYPO|nr:ubiquitin carboxyl-terminal hydrolase 2 [Cordyceps javanica]TQW11143.1 ubiquitin carboxyl-terminal hydrolase 2 [Cordyceps javanica]